MEIVFNPGELEGLANRFKILAEPTRLQSLAALCNQEHSVQEICDRIQNTLEIPVRYPLQVSDS